MLLEAEAGAAEAVGAGSSSWVEELEAAAAAAASSGEFLRFRGVAGAAAKVEAEAELTADPAAARAEMGSRRTGGAEALTGTGRLAEAAGAEVTGARPVLIYSSSENVASSITRCACAESERCFRVARDG